ncbi:hypothetical protein BCR44DRAFT_1482648 [Catenaria anguillulae PL171]|uniref:Dynein heavy chain linker domain-containing protein n=1 Tax=Catenaria anguillulae PL171 TaxID=765915 RepID=A0A1Y2I1R0_9FUNG|nr:hypothetical protein BCR44DRAFT_1482648 [Catenaria anguillulae PL171]
MWHQIAALRLRTPGMPRDVSQRIVDRLMAVAGEWKVIKKRPKQEDWAEKLSEHKWHWMFAMKQAAMIGPTRNDKDLVAFQNVNANKVLPGDGSVVAWNGAWASVTSIRASLMDTLDHLFEAEFPISSSTASSRNVPVKPFQDWCKGMSAKRARIEHKLLVNWRAAATKAISQVPCLGHMYVKVPRLVDCLVHTLFQEAVDRMHSATLDAVRVDQEIGAPFTRPRHSLRLEPTAVQTRQLMVQVVGELHQALTERWTPFTRAYARGDSLISQLSTCLWLLDPGPESVCYTQDAPIPNSDCTWRTDMLSHINTVLGDLARCRPMLFDRSSTAATVGDIVHFDVGTAVRRLRARWRVWDACCRKQLAHVFQTASAQLERIYASATQTLHVSGVGTDPGTWTVLAQTLSRQQQQLDLAHAVASQLATWWAVCYEHQVDVADADSERYWLARAIPRQLACEYAVANEELARARRDFVARVRVTTAHIEGSLEAHGVELADIGREKQAGEAVKVARRVAALRVRVEKLVAERDTVVTVQTAIGMRAEEMDPGHHQHDTWPGVMDLMGKVMRASRLWDTAVAIQDALATYRKTFFTQLPRDALGAQLLSWKETLVSLLLEHPSSVVEDVNARQVVDQVHAQCAAIANMWPILYALSSPHLQMRHWFQITKRIGLAAHDLEMLTLEQVLEQKLDLLTDILLTGSGAHKLSGWDTWEMPLTEAAVREREKRGAKASSVANDMMAMTSLDHLGHNANASSAAGPLPPGQEALVMTIRTNSIHLDAVASGPHLWPSITRTIAGAHGPTTKLVNRHQVTIPFTRIVSIQIRPPDARRYLTRELEWLAWNGSKKLASLTVGGEQEDRLDCVDEEEDEVEAAQPAFLTSLPSALGRPPGALPPSNQSTKQAVKSHPAVPTISTTVNGHSAVRRGIWCTRRGNVFYYVACSTEESVGDPVLEAQLMGQSAIALYLEPTEDEMPLSKVVVSVPRGVTPELFAERLQNACAREIIME